MSLRAAVVNQDAVVCVLGHGKFLRPTAILSEGTQNLIAAMREAGVRRLVCQTSLGVGDSFGRMGIYYTLFVVPFILQFYFWDKHRQEKAIRASGLEVKDSGKIMHFQGRVRTVFDSEIGRSPEQSSESNPEQPTAAAP